MKLPYIALTLAYCGIIFWLSSEPSPPVPDNLFPLQDKVSHAVLYGGLAFVVALGLRRSGRPWRAVPFFLAPVLFAFIYGVSDEIHQTFVPQREFDPWDIVSDGLGALAVQAALWQWGWRGAREASLPLSPDQR